jgi:predicted membrane protein
MGKSILDTLLMILKLMQYVALLLVVFYVLFHTKFFYKPETEDNKRVKSKIVIRQVLLILAFGLASIIATESGIEMYGGIANIRDLAPIVAGLIAGPVAGTGAGLIGALYRLTLGGFASIPCSIATALAGLAGGIFYLFRKGKFISPMGAIIFGTLYEVFLLGLILLIAHPMDRTLEAVWNSGPSMIFVNALGLFLFSFLVRQYRNQLKIMADQKKIENELEVVNSLQTSILPAISSDVQKEIEHIPSVDKLLPLMKKEHFSEGEFLFRKEDNADKLFYIDEGLLELVEINKIVGKGSIIGETGIFSPFHKRTISARCYTNIDVFSINQEELMKLLYTLPSLFFDLIQLTIRRFTVNLKNSISEKDKIESELKIAHSIQTNLLTRNFYPERKEVEIFATMTPAREVAGDFYDFFFISDNRLFFTIADVSGKGIPGALFMVITKTLLKTEALRCVSPGEILNRVNNVLAPDNEECMFVTLFCGILDIKTGKMEYSNAGHNPPLLYKYGGEFDFMNIKSGFVLAAMEGFNYTTEKISLQTGDTLFLYTDGITEAMNPEKKLFSNKRLKETLCLLKGKNVKEIITGVKREVKQFAGEEPQYDDITMLAYTFKG